MQLSKTPCLLPDTRQVAVPGGTCSSVPGRAGRRTAQIQSSSFPTLHKGVGSRTQAKLELKV